MKPPSDQIVLDFTVSNLERLLEIGGSPNPRYSHYQIADWRLRMFNQFHDEDCDDQLNHALSVACDVECQWDLFLVNTYSVNELRGLDPDSVSLPLDWFKDWRTRLTETANKAS